MAKIIPAKEILKWVRKEYPHSNSSISEWRLDTRLKADIIIKYLTDCPLEEEKLCNSCANNIKKNCVERDCEHFNLYQKKGE